jgi:hypothetical protein
MAISEQERHDVHKWFEEAMGPDRAANLMSLLPPVGWADVATKRDLDSLEQGLGARIEVLGSGLRSELANGLHRQTRVFVGWMIAGVGTVMGTTVGVLALVT